MEMTWYIVKNVFYPFSAFCGGGGGGRDRQSQHTRWCFTHNLAGTLTKWVGIHTTVNNLNNRFCLSKKTYLQSQFNCTPTELCSSRRFSSHWINNRSTVISRKSLLQRRHESTTMISTKYTVNKHKKKPLCLPFFSLNQLSRVNNMDELFCKERWERSHTSRVTRASCSRDNIRALRWPNTIFARGTVLAEGI